MAIVLYSGIKSASLYIVDAPAPEIPIDARGTRLQPPWLKLRELTHCAHKYRDVDIEAGTRAGKFNEYRSTKKAQSDWRYIWNCSAAPRMAS